MLEYFVMGLPSPKKTLTSDQIIIFYVKLFLNNEKKQQMDGLVRKPIFWGGQSNIFLSQQQHLLLIPTE